MDLSQATSSLIHAGVRIGPGAEIGPFCILGQPCPGETPGQRSTEIGRGAVIRSHTVIYAGNRIGDNFMTGHGALIREDNRIGDDVSVGSHSIVEHHVVIGNGVRVHSQAFIPEFSVLEDEAWIGPNVVLTNVPHPRCPKANECVKGPTIRRGAKIGANATLAPAIEIGIGALVGSGAMVVKSVPPGAVVAGNPARIVKSIDELTCPYDLIEHPYPPLESLIR
ncbi:MAG TPA: acyltransferase [Chloroflexota bacterium]|nr:acyltransferase [Chloroflexota bacterium]